MQALIKYVVVLFFLICHSSCGNADLSGIFKSNTTVDKRFEESMKWNAENPYQDIPVSTDNYIVLALGDAHVGGTKNLNRFFNDAKEKDAVATVLVGDVCTGHASDYHVLKEHIPNQTTLPSFIIPGNHELYFEGWDEYSNLFGTSVYYFPVTTPSASDLFICLDTAGGTLGNKQYQWLKDLLKQKRNSYRYCFLFTHNNFFRGRKTATTNPPVEELRSLLDLFVKYNVNYVISGHDHQRNVDYFGNTCFITMDAIKDGFNSASYLQIVCNSQEISTSFVEVE